MRGLQQGTCRGKKPPDPPLGKRDWTFLAQTLREVAQAKAGYTERVPNVARWILVPLVLATNGCSFLDHVTPDEQSSASSQVPDHFAQLGFALESTCAALKDGRLFCWGVNLTDQFGSAFPDASASPVQVDPGAKITGVGISAIAGNGAGCVATEDGSVLCAGDDVYAQLANGPSVVASGSFESILDANDVPIGGLRSIHGGPFRFCTVDTAGLLSCWGESGWGQSGSNGGQTVVPRSLASGVIGVAMGGVFTCIALDASPSVMCFGNRDHGELGNAPTQPGVIDGVGAFDPVSVGLEELGFHGPARSLSAGYSHACAVDAERALYCWGENDSGQTGTGTENVRRFRWLDGGTLKDFDGQIAEVACVDRTTCVLLSDGSIQCFGKGELGLLGDGSTATRASPGPVALSPMRHISGGSTTLCAHSGKELHCWGENSGGQLGNGQTSPLEASPVRVLFP
jgi:alpha-tubulin suppressor-like RCC1 family protein